MTYLFILSWARRESVVLPTYLPRYAVEALFHDDDDLVLMYDFVCIVFSFLFFPSLGELLYQGTFDRHDIHIKPLMIELLSVDNDTFAELSTCSLCRLRRR